MKSEDVYFSDRTQASKYLHEHMLKLEETTKSQLVKEFLSYKEAWGSKGLVRGSIESALQKVESNVDCIRQKLRYTAWVDSTPSVNMWYGYEIYGQHWAKAIRIWKFDGEYYVLGWDDFIYLTIRVWKFDGEYYICGWDDFKDLTNIRVYIKKKIIKKIKVFMERFGGITTKDAKKVVKDYGIDEIIAYVERLIILLPGFASETSIQELGKEIYQKGGRKLMIVIANILYAIDYNDFNAYLERIWWPSGHEYP